MDRQASINSAFILANIALRVAGLARQAILVQKINKNTGRKEWCLVSKKDRSKVLEWYGPKKPSKERVEKTEKRVQWFKSGPGKKKK